MQGVFIELTPTPKGRPRFGKGRVYTDRATERAEKAFALVAGQHRPPVPYADPLEVHLLFVMPKPKSYAKRFFGCPHVKKPDLDNLVKLVLDALQRSGEWWIDDAQVVKVVCSKRYQLEGELVGTWSRVELVVPPGVQKVC